MRYFIMSVVIILVAMYFMPVTLRINILKDGKNDKITVSLKTLYGLLKLKTEIPFLILTFENGKPALKYKIEIADRKRSKLYARFSKIFSMPEGEGIYRIYKNYKDRIVPSLKYIARKLEVVELSLKLKYGTGEAAATGMLYGAAWIILGSVLSFTKGYLRIREPRIMVVPVFGCVQLNMDFNCIITLKTGHIINTGIRVIPVLLSISNK